MITNQSITPLLDFYTDSFLTELKRLEAVGLAALTVKDWRHLRFCSLVSDLLVTKEFITLLDSDDQGQRFSAVLRLARFRELRAEVCWS